MIPFPRVHFRGGLIPITKESQFRITGCVLWKRIYYLSAIAAQNSSFWGIGSSLVHLSIAVASVATITRRNDMMHRPQMGRREIGPNHAKTH